VKLLFRCDAPDRRRFLELEIVPAAGWDEVEVALAVLNYFNAVPVPQITHGICPDCLQQARQALSGPTGKKPE
jgi:hypothetical protein